MSRHALIAIAIALCCLPVAYAAEPPTHAAVEIYPSLLEGLARAADFPFQMVSYDGGEASCVLPPKGRWGAGECGHLRKLDLFVDAPGDVALRFESEQVTPDVARPIARLEMTLRGPAEAEWWSKLPLQGDWGLVKRFKERIALQVRTRAQIAIGKADSGNPCVSLVFDPVKGEDVKLNVRRYPPWLDRLIETQFDVAEQVDTHLAQQLAPRMRLELPSLTVPYLSRPLTIEDLRPSVRNGILRVEMTIGHQ